VVRHQILIYREAVQRFLIGSENASVIASPTAHGTINNAAFPPIGTRRYGVVTATLTGIQVWQQAYRRARDIRFCLDEDIAYLSNSRD
jgi:hypothetical protein